MGWQEFFVGLCLVLVFEGIMPFLSPGKYKEMLQKISQLDDNQLKKLGFFAMLVGIIMLFLIKGSVG